MRASAAPLSCSLICLALGMITMASVSPQAAAADAGTMNSFVNPCIYYKSLGEVNASCFGTQNGFKLWQSCVLKARDPKSCYIPPVATRATVTPVVPLPAPPAGRHLRFKYALVQATEQQVLAVRSYAAMKALVGSSASCTFEGDVATNRQDVTVDNYQPYSIFFGASASQGYVLKFDVTGQPQPGCALPAATWLQTTFRSFGPATATGWSDYHSEPSESDLVQVASRNYRPMPLIAHVGTQEVLQYGVADNVSVGYPLADGVEVSGSFAFFAKAATDERYMVVYDGTFRLFNRR